MKQLLNRTVVTSFTPSSSSSVSTDFDEGHYVLHVACGPQSPPSNAPPPPSFPYLSCAMTNHSITTYDVETLQPIHSIDNAHKFQITDLCHGTIHGGNNRIVASSGQDGKVQLYDVRSNAHQQPVVQISLARNEQALSLSLGYDGALAAVGGEKGHIHFFDLRHISNGAHMNQPLGTYCDSHTEEVTKVRFQPGAQGFETTSLLISGSEDGLACIFDTSQASEEKALKSVLNIQSPLREVGFFGPALEGVYCLTGSESMSVWHHDSAQRIFDFGNVRSTLSAQAGIPIHYLVNCHWNGTELNLLAGNSDGISALYRVDAASISFKEKLDGGHRGCIRDYTVLNKGECIITGGEDSRICEWKFGNSVMGQPKIKGTKSTGEERYVNAGGGKMKRSKVKKAHAPYNRR